MNFDENDKWEVGHFSLIEENRGYLDVFIEYDEKAEDLLEEYRNCYEIQNINERQKLIPIKKRCSSILYRCRRSIGGPLINLLLLRSMKYFIYRESE